MAMTTSAPLPDPIDVCGLPVHPLTLDQSVRAVERLINSGGRHQHVVVNAGKLVQAQDDEALARVIRDCSMINADGQSIVWASRVLGRPLPERVAGIDLMHALLESAARNGYRVFLLGATEHVVRSVSDVCRRQGVNVVGHRDGYWCPDEEAAVVRQVRESRPHLLFLGIPSPRKEFFLAEHLHELGVNVAFGVGGSFDVVAGLRKRAPRWLQRVGLEWAFRFVQEPRRMFRRYLVGNSRFVWLVVRAALRASATVGAGSGDMKESRA